MPVVELTRARIEHLQIDPDDLYARDWVEVAEIMADARHAANVVLSTWLHEELDGDAPSSLYRAVLPDGSRSAEVRWPDPNARRRAA